MSRKNPQILAAARELFWKHGFKRITVEEICEKAGVSKMTFYKSFPDKISIAKAVFEQEVTTAMVRFRKIMTDNSSPHEKIRAMLAMKSDSTTNISQEFINDFYSSERTELVGFVQELTVRTWKEAIADFKAAQAAGVFRADFKPELLFTLAQKISESLTDPRVQSLYPNPHDLVVDLSKLFCYGIAPGNEK